MSISFFEQPILNSPYKYPTRHWQLDGSGKPTNKVLDERRPASLISPVPASPKSKQQKQLVFQDTAAKLETENQQYDLLAEINDLRTQVGLWRDLPRSQWRVTPETARLLQHWRDFPLGGIRPFFCQVEAVEIVIWLTEVAPKRGKVGERFLDYLEEANDAANQGLRRLALKLATGTGKTTVMAMLIAWQTINAVRRPNSKQFTKGFLVVTPGLTIKDRLRVLQPNDPDSYYKDRSLVPSDMLRTLEQAKIVITNFHAFRRRESLGVSRVGRSLLQGRDPGIRTLETEGQMIQRVMPELMGMRNVVAFNDEAHHCYRGKSGEAQEGVLKGDDLVEASKNTERARLWISGLDAVHRMLGISRTVDLSATPFFLRGSGYAEGTLFPWTMSDFSLMDAIESGIVKLPRIPVADNVPGDEAPLFRYLWDHIGKKMPKKGLSGSKGLDPLKLPNQLQTALEALYGHYEKTYVRWREAGTEVEPCFIVVCNNTSTSKLVYDYISGFIRTSDDGSTKVQNGRFELFRNYDESGQPYARPRTLLIDSEQLESGEALDRNFRQVASDEIERFRREIIARTGDRRHADNLSDQDLLREVVNSVGKPGRLGGFTRCVVSVAMLTEGWDANTVTHILGIRAFGTQLLCEQVVGRALRRYSYQLNESGLFDAEYADILGIPFDFAAQTVPPPPPRPPDTVLVHAVRPDRDDCEITFPRVVGYRIELPEEHLSATFDNNSKLTLRPDTIGPGVTRNQGLIGEAVDLDLSRLESTRPSEVAYYLTRHLLEEQWSDPSAGLHLFGQCKKITREWLDDHLDCTGDTYPAQILYKDLAELACERIIRAITKKHVGNRPVKAIIDPYNPTGSTKQVHFYSSRRPFAKGLTPGKSLWETKSNRCHVNLAACDSSWEADFCYLVEDSHWIRAYVKNEGLGFEVPYRFGAESRMYLPDFILLLEDGHGEDDLLHIVVEIKGYRREDAKDKASTMENYWIPGVNSLGTFGRWAFIELGGAYAMEDGFDARSSIRGQFAEAMRRFMREAAAAAAQVLIQSGGTHPSAEYIPRRRPEQYQ